MHCATRRKHIQAAVLLINAGCQLDIADIVGETPLLIAARDGVLEIVRAACAYGCNVDVVNKVINVNCSYQLLVVPIVVFFVVLKAHN